MYAVKRDFVGYGNDYPKIEWPNGARIAVSLVVNFEEGSEKTPLNGDEFPEGSGDGFTVKGRRRDVRNESAFDYGTRRGFWRLMDIFDKHGVKITVFGCAMALELNRDASRAVVDAGHEIISHGYRWIPHYELTRDEEREHIRRAAQVIEDITGKPCQGWFSRNPSDSTRELLVEHGGFLYECDSMADDLPYFIDVLGTRVLVIPYSLELNDGRFGRAPGYSEPRDFFLRLKEAFDCLYEEGESHPQMMSVGLHLRTVGRPARATPVDEFIEYAKGHPGVWFARRIDIARWWLDNYSDLPTLAG